MNEVSEKMATASAMLAYAFRISSEISSGRIGPEICNRTVNIITGDAGVHLEPDPSVSRKELSAWSTNMVMLALYGSALTCDELLDSTSIGKSQDQSDIGIVVLVNQLRNAFAHSPWLPKWRIFPKYRKAYPIKLANGASFTFPAHELDGEFVKPGDYGGLEFWLALLKQCEGMVEL